MTQSGQAGIKMHTSVFTPIHRTLKEAFPQVGQALGWGWGEG